MNEGYLDKAIMDVIKKYPKVGDMLSGYDIACVTCKVGICKLKDIVKIHGLGSEKEKEIFEKINQIINGPLTK